MPKRQPFTRLCQQLATHRADAPVDLHTHTTCSDGFYSPEDLVDLARRSGLAALAVTDHDTIDACAAARTAARGSSIEVVSGVEISAEFHERELHLLGYFFDESNAPLQTALRRLREHRWHRFGEIVARLRQRGIRFDASAHPSPGTTPGRLHVARLLVQNRHASNVRDAFQRFLSGTNAVPKVRLPVAEAIALLRNAGGVSSWAHPGNDCTKVNLLELRSLGLHAVEAAYPSVRPSRVREIRNLAQDLGLAVTGGSDCHGPGKNAVGCQGITLAELEALRERTAAATAPSLPALGWE